MKAKEEKDEQEEKEKDGKDKDEKDGKGDSQTLCGLLAGYVTHPNVAGATVLSLGCQNAQVSMLEEEIAKRSPDFDKPLYILEQQKIGEINDLIAQAIKKTFAGLMIANQQQRKPAPVNKICISKVYGVSDEDVAKAQDYNRGAYAIVTASTDIEQLKTDLTSYYNTRFKDNPDFEVPQGMTADELIQSMVDQIANPWMQYFIQHDPAPVRETS